MSPEQYSQIGEIYRAALELGVGDWEVFLAKACGGDENLRQEVASLLAQRSKADHWIDHPAVEIAARALATPQSDSWVGQQVHHYQVTSLLGAGGMGQVYLACDIRIGRDVAIKVLPTTYSSNSEWLHRFEREARAAG